MFLERIWLYSAKIDQFSKIKNWAKLKNKQHHSKVLLNR